MAGTTSLSQEQRALLAKILQSAGVSAGRQPTSEIPRRDRSMPLPLSYPQQRLWFMDRLAPNNPFYNVPLVIPLSGPVDVVAVQESLSALASRHEILRTTYAMENHQPVQVVSSARAKVPLSFVDLRDLAPDRRRVEASRLAEIEARRPFDLGRGPVMRATLVSFSAVEHHLLLSMHHIACDGWSMGVVTRELEALYAPAKAAELPDLPIQYADFAAWQRARLEEEDLKPHLDYWREKLRGLPETTLPLDYPRPATPSFSGDLVRLRVPERSAVSLRGLAAAEGATPFMVLLCCFAAALGRYADQETVVVGSPIAGRDHRDVEPLIGLFVNLLVMQLDVPPQASFREVLGKTRKTVLEAFDHQQVPFERLVQEIETDRRLDRNPLFQIGFVLQTAWEVSGTTSRRQQVNGTGADSAPDFHRGTAIFDLTMHLWEDGEGWQGVIEYSSDLFERSSMLRLAELFQSLVDVVAGNPDVKVAGLSLPPEAELERVLQTWNPPSSDEVEVTCFHHLFERQVEQTPDAPALRFDDKTMTYHELDLWANYIAHELRARGVGPESVVLLSIGRSFDVIAGLLGILKAGGAYLPLDTRYPSERLQWMVKDSGAKFALIGESAVEVLGEAAGDDAVWMKIEDLRGQKARPPDVDVGPDNLAYLIYTSGSTGRPKGVMVEHRGLGNVVVAQRRVLGAGPNHRVLQFASLSFDASIFEIALALGNGGTLCLGSAEEFLPGPSLTSQLVAERVTTIVVPPSTLAQMDPSDLPDLMTVCVAGEACPAILVNRWAPDRRMFNLYGPTEATIWATYAECRAGEGIPPIGRPIPNTQAFVLDSAQQPVPIGLPGEIYLGGAGLARGYLHQQQLTEDRFVSLKLRGEQTERLYRTGDRGRFRPDGAIEYLGRTDFQAKIRGFRIEPAEIEEALLAHPSVHEAVVLSRDDRPGDPRLVAYLTAVVDQHRESGEGDPIAAEHVRHWRDLYDALYGLEGGGPDPAFDFIGWNSSYTGEQLPTDEMAIWLDSTIDRIRGLAPTRILEIGCGTGLLALRLAQDCLSYTASDFSASALECLRARLPSLGPAARHIRLVHGDATRLGPHLAGGHDTERHDVIVINSVTQYFPDRAYLESVLRGAVESVGESGAVFIGDVRHLGLSEVFASSVELARAPAADSARALRERVRRRVELDQELSVDPQFFLGLAGRLPKVSAVEFLAKQGSYANELSKYRYDVVFHIGVQPQTVTDAETQSWSSLGTGLLALGERLATEHPERLLVTDIPDNRQSLDIAAERLLRLLGDDAPVGDLSMRASADAVIGADPASIGEIAAAHNYAVEFHLAGAGTGAGRFDAVFHRTGRRTGQGNGHHRGRAPIPHIPIPRLDDNGPRRARPETLTSSPLRAAFARNLVPRLRGFLQESLPQHLIPAHFVLLDELPRTPNGKIDRRRLPPPDSGRPDLGSDYVVPSESTERLLAEVWQEILGLSKVGRHDNFFELGGDSILAIQIVAKARDAGISLAPRDLFQHQTVATLATVCRAMAPSAISVSDAEGELPLSPVQHWFAEQAPASPHHFNQALMVRLPKRVKHGLLQQALDHILDHHDALRLRFHIVAGSWHQRFAELPQTVPLALLDLSLVAADVRENTLSRALVEAHEALHLTNGPMFRALLVDFGTSEPMSLFLVAHHLVIDAVSWTILMEDLATAMRQLESEEPVSLPRKTSSFKSWAEHLAVFASSRHLAFEAKHWAALSAPDHQPLPVDHMLGPNNVASVDLVTVVLPEAASSALVTGLQRKYSAGVDTALLTALVRATFAWNGLPRLLVDVETHGRETLAPDVEVSRTVGWFTSIFPVRLDIAAERDLEGALSCVREQMHAVPNRGIGYGTLRYLSPDKDIRDEMRAVPQPEVAFTYFGQVRRRIPATNGRSRNASDEMETGPARAASGQRLHKIEIAARLGEDGLLRTDFGYTTNLFRKETITRLADRFSEELTAIARLAVPADGESATTQDFGRSGLNDGDLAKLRSRLGLGNGGARI
jgi:amino acid adenylation domain-containing protein/non-ribosomal peptide synthase protein (TIGR01720 family)